MTTEAVNQRHWVWILVFALAGVPAFILRVSGADLDPVVTAIIYGLGIVGGAFLLSWAAEAAQLDVSASFAIAVLALIAILPEYAIEAVLAWDAGNSYDPTTGAVTEEMQRVAANVTGSNRLLIGLGWSLVILIYWLKRRQSLDLRGHLSLEIKMLIAATAMTFIVFFMNQVHIVVAAILIAMYIYYLWASSRQASEEPELMGPSLVIGSLPARKRRSVVTVIFVYSAAVILVAAEPFVDSLVETGLELGIDEFILIQWIAPLASESPEIIVAILFSLRANPMAGITTLISAEVNQLTVLVGSMVVVFSASVGEPLSFLLDARQSTEFFLTAAVSSLAIVLIIPRRIWWGAGLVLLVLFFAHLPFTSSGGRQIFSDIYLGLTVGVVFWYSLRYVQERRNLAQATRASSSGIFSRPA